MSKVFKALGADRLVRLYDIIKFNGGLINSYKKLYRYGNRTTMRPTVHSGLCNVGAFPSNDTSRFQFGFLFQNGRFEDWHSCGHRQIR